MQLKRSAIGLVLVMALVAPVYAQSDGGDQDAAPPDESVQVDAAPAPPPTENVVPPFDPARPCDQYWELLRRDDLVQSMAEARQARALQGLDASDLPSIDQLIAWHGQLSLAKPDARIRAVTAGCF